MSTDLLVDVGGGVARVTLNRPAKRNAVTYEMWVRLGEVCTELSNDDAVRLLVITGEGDHFCAGADVGGLGGSGDYASANADAERAIADFPKPSIAFIRGSCVGGGAQIALACDLRLAESTARFGITPARLGILYPNGAVERTVRTIGPSATKHLLYSAEIIDAERALRIGLIDELLDPTRSDERLDELAKLLVSHRSLFTQMASKAMVDDIVQRGGITDETAATWATASDVSGDAREGINAFIERRQPEFGWTPNGGVDS